MKLQENTIILKAESRLAQALKRMLIHKRLKEQFWKGDISLIELNQLLLEQGINKKYEHETAV